MKLSSRFLSFTEQKVKSKYCIRTHSSSYHAMTKLPAARHIQLDWVFRDSRFHGNDEKVDDEDRTRAVLRRSSKPHFDIIDAFN